MLGKMSEGSIELTDFDFIRQTVFPRMRVALQAQLGALGRLDDLTLLARKKVGDDTEFVYRATWGRPAQARQAFDRPGRWPDELRIHHAGYAVRRLRRVILGGIVLVLATAVR